MWIRFVLVPGLTDAEENVDAIGKFVATLDGVQRMEILPFHQMGKSKWEATGEPYLLADTDRRRRARGSRQGPARVARPQREGRLTAGARRSAFTLHTQGGIVAP